MYFFKIEQGEKFMGRKRKKPIDSERLSRMVGIRISENDYKILIERAKSESSDPEKVIFSKYLCGILHDSTISNYHFLKINFRQIDQQLINIDSRLLQIQKNTEVSGYPLEMIQKISECLILLQNLQADFQKTQAEVSKWLSQN